MKNLILVLMLLCSSLAFADFQAKVGQFALNTTATTVTTTIGCQPKAMILWTFGKTSGTESGTAAYSMGFTDGTHLFVDAWASDDAVATSNAGLSFFTTNVLRVLTNGTPTVGTGGQINSVSFLSTGFTTTQNANATSAWLVNYVAFCGSDITNAFVGTFTNPTSVTGPQSITAPGFQGNVIFTMGALTTAVGNVVSSSVSFGAATSSTKRFAFAGTTQDGQTTSGTILSKSIFESTKLFELLFSSNASVIFSADFSGFTTTGFNYNITTASASGWEWGYLVIQGGQWDVGSGAKPTTATTQTVTGEAFQPSFLGLFTSSATTTTAVTANQISSFGAANGTNQVFANAIELDQINTVAKSSGSTTACLLDRDGTNNPSASFTSFNSDGWTITWNATGSARQVGWITGATSGGSGSVPVMPVIY